MKMPAIHSASHLEAVVIAQLIERSNKGKGRGEGIGKKKGGGERRNKRRGGRSNERERE